MLPPREQIRFNAPELPLANSRGPFAVIEEPSRGSGPADKAAPRPWLTFVLGGTAAVSFAALVVYRWRVSGRRAAAPPVLPPMQRNAAAVAALAARVAQVAEDAAPGRFQRIKFLGRGQFGEVHECIDHDNNAVVAVKAMRDVRAADVGEECRKEFEMARAVRHPFIVAMYALEDDPATGGSRLIMELCPGGSLLDALRRDGAIDEVRLRCYARQLLLGLNALHKGKIIHRDIKPANVLVDAVGRLKLTDFGMSRHMDSMHTRTGMAGSPAYMSPEACEGRYKPGTDLWALGATLCQLLTNQAPWSHVQDRDLRNPNAMCHYICHGPSGSRDALPADHHPAIPSGVSQAARDFFKTLFAINVDARGTCEELLRHPFITNGGPAVTEDNYLGFLDTSTTDSILTSPVSERDSTRHTAHGFDVGTHTATTNDFELASAGPQARVQVTQQPLQRSATDATPSNSSVTRPPTATTGRASNGTVTTTTTTTTGTRQSQADGVSTATEHPGEEEEEDPAEYGGAMPSPSSGGMDSMHAAAASHVSSSSSAPTTEFLAASCHPDDPLPP